MSVDDIDAHLTPELFVDVLEKHPVDAERWRHLERCSECAAELRELEKTLELLHHEREREAKDKPIYSAPHVWVAAAALVLLAFSLLFRGTPAYAPASPDLLLPPVETDDGFQLLVALSEELGESATADAVAESGVLVSPELTELTHEERERLVERLTQEVLRLESSS